MNYDELIRCLRDCWDDSTGPSCDCDHCLFRDKIVDDVGYTDYTKCETAMVIAAADAVEELTAELEYTKRQYDLAVEDLEKIGWGEWIPVTDRLPEKYHQVLVYGLNGMQIDYYAGEKSIGGCPLFMISEAKVTHWMPLPEPPHSEFYESLKTALEQAINVETRSYTLVQALEDAGAEVKPGTGKMFCNGKEVDPEEVFESCFPPPSEDQP